MGLGIGITLIVIGMSLVTGVINFDTARRNTYDGR